MKSGPVILAMAVTALCQCSAITLRVTPTVQVINMLTEMKTKGERMLQDEKLTYAKYAQWADDTTKDLALEIKNAARKIEELSAFIDKADSDVAELGREIAALQAEINNLESEKKQATDDRNTQNSEYLKISADYAESVDALQQAIQTLSAQNYNRAQAEVLLQQLSSKLPGMPRVLAAIQKVKGSTRREDNAPEVAAYEFQSGGIMEVLKNLLDRFKDELGEVETAESNEAHNHALLELHLSNTIARDTSDVDEKVITKGKRITESASAKGELSELKADKAADEKLKADTETALRLRKDTFEENQRVRAAELETLAEAIEIISSPAVAKSYAKHVSLAQKVPAGGAGVFMQLGRRTRRVDLRHKAAQRLLIRAKALKSETLASLAAAMTENPFAKVITMIETLLERLKSEAASEATHKAWCDQQLYSNKLRRNEKTAEVNKLAAEVEDYSARIADMGATIATLLQEQAELAKKMGDATTVRQDEKKENEAVIADSANGAEAVKRALVILKEFYSSQAAFVQQEPELASYTGMQSGKKGVVGMLEVIETDFIRLKAATETAEREAASQYETLMKDSQVLQKQKHEAEVQLRLDEDQAEFEQSRVKKDLAATQTELEEAQNYFAQLQPSCIEVHVSFEERAARRKEEIEALKEAYTILGQKAGQ